MGSIQAINYAIQASNSTDSNESLAQQLEDLIQQLREHMGDADQTQLFAIMQKIETFLIKNKNLIMEQCALNGYNNNDPNWQEHYATFFNGAINALQTAIAYHNEHPTEHINPDSINEFITQLQFLMSNPKKSLF